MFAEYTARLSAFLVAFFAPRPARTGRLAQAKAVTFLEYALLATIALAVFLVFKTVFPGIFSGLLDKIKNAVGVA